MQEEEMIEVFSLNDTVSFLGYKLTDSFSTKKEKH